MEDANHRQKVEETLEVFKIVFANELGNELESSPFSMTTVWRAVRDRVLPEFPILAAGYEAHGREYNLPFHEQSPAAHTGRKVAGVMGFACDVLDRRYQTIAVPPAYDDEEETEIITAWDDEQYTPKDPDPEVPEEPEAPGPLLNVTAEPTDELVYKTRGLNKAARARMFSYVTDVLTDTPRGTSRIFWFDNRAEARSLQQAIKKLVRDAGWYDDLEDGQRPYRSNLLTPEKTDGQGHGLQVRHLSDPVPEKQYS